MNNEIIYPVRIPEVEYEQLREKAKQDKRSIASLILIAIDKLLKEETKNG